MLTVKVLNKEGKESGSVELPESVFGIEPNEHAVWLDVRQYLANQRQGTHKAKERGEVAGSTKKIKRQKGTGGARAGDIKNPLFRGGGRVFGPRPRNYGFKLNKKVKQLARKSALSAKMSAGNILVVDSLQLEDAKTKNALAMLQALGLDNKKVVFVTPEMNAGLLKATGNIRKTQVNTASDLFTYQLVNAETIVLDQKSIENLTQILA